MYSTNDLSLAAFLMIKGHEVNISANGTYCTFSFPISAESDAMAYLHGASAPARIYAQTLRQLKAMAISAKAQNPTIPTHHQTKGEA